VNKRDRELELSIPGATGGQIEAVDQSTASNPPASSKLASDSVTVNGLGVAVVTLP
jgi:hypothetical protein